MMHRFVTVFALLLLACGSIDVDIDFGGDDPLADTEWRLTSLGPASGPTPAVSGSDATAEFMEEEMRGWTGCNGYSGTYKVSDSSFSAGDDLLWTERGCPSAELLEQEGLFLDLLVAAESFTLSGDQLVISSEEGQSVLVFTRTGE